MRHYEMVILAHAQRGSEVAAAVDKYKSIVKEKNGSVTRYEDWGLRKLAYPIKKMWHAHYVLLNMECSSESLDEIREDCRYNDVILRNLVISKDNLVDKPSAIALKMLATEKEEKRLAKECEVVEGKAAETAAESESESESESEGQAATAADAKPLKSDYAGDGEEREEIGSSSDHGDAASKKEKELTSEQQ